MRELLENKLLTLSLCEERYAIPIGCVREVLEYSRVTRLPCTAGYLKGIINLRGQSIPVLDLRTRFGMPESSASQGAAIIVVEIEAAGGRMTAGIQADAVHEVVEIERADVEAPPRFGAGNSTGYLRGIGRTEGGFILILDLGLVFDESDARVLSEALEAEAASA